MSVARRLIWDGEAAPDMPLPDLTEITWGETGDGKLAAIGTLRALSDGR